MVALQVLVEPTGGTAVDTRLMLGQSVSLWGWPTFVDIDPGARLRADPYPNEARLDMTAGLRPTERLLLLAQEFGSFAHSAGPFIARQSYSKLQLSAVYDLSIRWSVQIGVFQTIAGRNAVRERGPLAAVWYRF